MLLQIVPNSKIFSNIFIEKNVHIKEPTKINLLLFKGQPYKFAYMF